MQEMRQRSGSRISHQAMLDATGDYLERVARGEIQAPSRETFDAIETWLQEGKKRESSTGEFVLRPKCMCGVASSHMC